MFDKLKRLGIVVIEEGKAKAAWWFIATAIPGINQFISKNYGYSVTEFLPSWFPQPTWVWGAWVFVAWIIFSLANRVLRHETPASKIEVVKDERDGSWWLEVRNVSGKSLNNCAVDFERVEDAFGKRVFPHSFGLLRSMQEKLSNPFPLRANQPKQGRFTELEDGKIVIWGMSIDRAITKISLQDEQYRVVVGAYSEAEGAQCKKVFTLSRESGELRVS